MKLFDYVTAEMQTVTAEDIARVASTLKEPDPINTHLMGVLNEELQKFFVVIQNIAKEAKEKKSGMSFSFCFDEGEAAFEASLREVECKVAKATNTEARIDEIAGLFWSAVREELQIWGETNVQICSNWQVIVKGPEVCELCGQRHLTISSQTLAQIFDWVDNGI